MMPRGGKREGAGRPSAVSGKAKHCIYCTKDELKAIRIYLQKLRSEAFLQSEINSRIVD